jgi:hypothetical protein
MHGVKEKKTKPEGFVTSPNYKDTSILNFVQEKNA